MGILSDIVNEDKVEMCPEACCGKPITECKCGPDCEHCDCHSKNAINEGTQGCADCEWIKDETDGDITTCDDCAAEKREKTNEAEKRWKQTSMSPQEAIAKYGKPNVKVKKGALRNGDDMVEVFVEGYKIRDKSRGYGVADATYKTRKAAQDAAIMKAASNGGDWEVFVESYSPGDVAELVGDIHYSNNHYDRDERKSEMQADAAKLMMAAKSTGDEDIIASAESVEHLCHHYDYDEAKDMLNNKLQELNQLVGGNELEVEESYSPGDEMEDGVVSNCCGAPLMNYNDGHGRCSDCKEMAAGETDEEYYESKVMQAREQIAQEESPVIEADAELQRIQDLVKFR